MLNVMEQSMSMPVKKKILPKPALFPPNFPTMGEDDKQG